MTRDSLVNWIKKYEGFKSKIYVNKMGKFSIGYGRNLEDVGINPYEADALFLNDFERTLRVINAHECFKEHPENVRDAIINMCFSLGISKLLKLDKMIEALKNNDYTLAAKEVLNSHWGAMDEDRAKDVALMIRQGTANEERRTDTPN